MKSIFFNAHHSSIGAFADFTLGYKGAKGGLGLELGKPVSFIPGVLLLFCGWKNKFNAEVFRMDASGVNKYKRGKDNDKRYRAYSFCSDRYEEVFRVLL